MPKQISIGLKIGILWMISVLLMSCYVTSFLSQEQGDNPTRTEPFIEEGTSFRDDTGTEIEVHPYLSPNRSLVLDAKPGAGWFIFLDNYFDVDPTWSPDDEFITFTSNRDGDTDIYSIHPDGTNLTNLTPDPSQPLASLLFLMEKALDKWPDWSPSGDQILFSSSRTNIMMNSSPSDLFIMNPDGTGVRQITDTVDMEGLPEWSPTGDRIVFVSDSDEGNQIYTMKPDGTEISKLTEGDMDNDMPAWSPDGSKIAFESNRDGDYDVYIMSSNGENLAQLTNESGLDTAPTWSPDGTKIAFVSARDGDLEIYTVDSEGNQIQQVTHNKEADYAPDWSHQSNIIAFVSVTTEGSRIFTIDLDTGDLNQVTGLASIKSPKENGVYHMYRALSLHYKEMELTQAIEAYSKAIEQDSDLAEAYLGRGMATLFDCEIIWMHIVGTNLGMYQWNEECSEVEDAILDIQTALDKGLAPALMPGTNNLLRLLESQ